MPEPNQSERVAAADRPILATILAVGCGVAVAAMLSAGAQARAQATPSNTSPPSISGTAVSGETLTASVGSWTGTPPISYALEWQRCDAAGANCAAIAGEAAQTYVLVGGDVGSTVRVLVTATNAEGSESMPSAPTVVVTAQTAPVNTGEPVISGSPVEGSTLSSTTGTWDGTSITFAYQWVRCDAGGGLPDGSDCPSIPGATSSSYTLTADDIGRRLRVQVIASNSTGSAAATSNPTDTVTQSTTMGPPRNTQEPSISGTATVGRVLFGTVGTWAGESLTYEYRWVRCNDDGGLPDGSNCTTISGAESTSYVLTTDDVGRRLRFRVTASNSLGTQSVASNATAPVQASTTGTTPAAQAPRNSFLPSIFGTPVVAGTLTATVGVWTGTAPLLYAYRWLRCDADGAACVEIAAATGTQYTPASADLGRRLRVEVTARNAIGTAAATSNPTAQVQAAGSLTPPTASADLPTGAIRLPSGTYSIPVTSVSPPDRLIAGDVAFTPSRVRSRTRPLELRVRVVDTRGHAVRDALVFARSTPLLTSTPGEVRTGRDGWARLRMTLRADFPLDGTNVQFFIRVRKQSDKLLEGVSNRRLVQVATGG
jgi:hypothetical protein